MKRVNVRSNEVEGRSLGRIARRALGWRLEGGGILTVPFLLNRIHELPAIVWLESSFAYL